MSQNPNNAQKQGFQPEIALFLLLHKEFAKNRSLLHPLVLFFDQRIPK